MFIFSYEFHLIMLKILQIHIAFKSMENGKLFKLLFKKYT